MILPSCSPLVYKYHNFFPRAPAQEKTVRKLREEGGGGLPPVRAVREVRALREVRDKQGIGGTRGGKGRVACSIWDWTNPRILYALSPPLRHLSSFEGVSPLLQGFLFGRNRVSSMYFRYNNLVSPPQKSNRGV
jgi:hypothetical protein